MSASTSDVYNSRSVKLAQATRVRLYLPGLGTGLDEDDNEDERTTAGSRTSSSTSDTQRKARRKLQKMQSIAREADTKHTTVIIDEEALEDEDSGDEREECQELARRKGSSLLRMRGPGSKLYQEFCNEGPSTTTNSTACNSDEQARVTKGFSPSTNLGKGDPGLGLPSTPTSPNKQGLRAKSGRGSQSKADEVIEACGPGRPCFATGQRVPIWERGLAPPAPKPAPVAMRTYQAVQPKTLSLGIGIAPEPVHVHVEHDYENSRVQAAQVAQAARFSNWNDPGVKAALLSMTSRLRRQGLTEVIQHVAAFRSPRKSNVPGRSVQTASASRPVYSNMDAYEHVRSAA